MKKRNRKTALRPHSPVAKERGDWGAISPVTKVIPNKKKNGRIKHKGAMYED